MPGDCPERWAELRESLEAVTPSGATNAPVAAVEPFGRQGFTLHPAPFLQRLARYCTFRRQDPPFRFDFQLNR
jgi:hypothetical protein